MKVNKDGKDKILKIEQDGNMYCEMYSATEITGFFMSESGTLYVTDRSAIKQIRDREVKEKIAIKSRILGNGITCIDNENILFLNDGQVLSYNLETKQLDVKLNNLKEPLSLTACANNYITICDKSGATIYQVQDSTWKKMVTIGPGYDNHCYIIRPTCISPVLTVKCQTN